MITSSTARMHSFVQSQILAYLRANARGHEHAIPRHVVMEHICYAGGDRAFRKLYEGIGIGSCNDGIFFPISPADVDFCRDYWTRGYRHEVARDKVAALLAARPELKPRTTVVQGNLFPAGA